MKSTIFLPQTIKVGFQKRSGTYTGKLAYVIYYDQKGKLRKEASWQSWRSKDIKPQEYNNEPMPGFVLNKKAGGYSTGWNHRQTYVRVYDPRGFEFEITIPNLLYILENTSSIKGKGLEGDFIYGWDGTDLLLVPTSSPDYAEITAFSKMIEEPESIKGKDLVLGGTYRTDKNEDWIYLGRFEEYETYTYGNIGKGEQKGKRYFFFYNGFKTLRSLTRKIVKVISTEPALNYAELMDQLSHKEIYSPHDPNKNEYVLYNIKELEEKNGSISVYLYYYGEFVSLYIKKYSNNVVHLARNYYANNSGITQQTIIEESRQYKTIEELHDKYKFHRLVRYLANGKELK